MRFALSISMIQTLRTINGLILTPILKITGYRFSRDYRYGTTKLHRLVYALVDTVGANLRAGL